MARNTKQKNEIINYLMSVKTHPTAEIIYLAIRKKIPSISKGTVYRILNSFVSEGCVQEILSDVSHYDGDLSNHAHFICRKCGSVYDVFSDSVDIKYNKNSNFGVIDNFQLNFYGICIECKI